jgi:hypothetical protein
MNTAQVQTSIRIRSEHCSVPLKRPCPQLGLPFIQYWLGPYCLAFPCLIRRASVLYQKYNKRTPGFAMSTREMGEHVRHSRTGIPRSHPRPFLFKSRMNTNLSSQRLLPHPLGPGVPLSDTQLTCTLYLSFCSVWHLRTSPYTRLSVAQHTLIPKPSSVSIHYGITYIPSS